MCGNKKMFDKIFCSPLSFVAVFGSGIRDPGWVKIRIQDKHPGSATLLFTVCIPIGVHIQSWIQIPTLNLRITLFTKHEIVFDLFVLFSI